MKARREYAFVVETLAQRLRRERVARGLTQDELAEKAGVDQSHISKLERGGGNPAVATIRALEKALGDPYVDLMITTLPDRDDPSLDRFLASDLARDLDPPLQQDEIESMRRYPWYGSSEEPSQQAWLDFIRARRAVRQKR